MPTINVSAHGRVNAPAPSVYGYIADMRNHHPHFLPAAFSDFAVESSTTWEGAGGIGGFFERTFAPRVLKGIYAEELASLDRYAQQQQQQHQGATGG